VAIDIKVKDPLKYIPSIPGQVVTYTCRV
jgi:hypothetical protein